jgi:hypothetical protein
VRLVSLSFIVSNVAHARLRLHLVGAGIRDGWSPANLT